MTEVVPASSPGVAVRVLGWMCDPLGPLSVRPGHVVKLMPWLVRFARSSSASEMWRISEALAALNGRVHEDLLPILAAVGLQDILRPAGAFSLYETDAGYRSDALEWRLKRAHGITCEELSGQEARQMEPALGSNVTRAVFMPQWSHVGDPKVIVDTLRDWLAESQVTFVRDEVQAIVGVRPPKLRLSSGAVVGADLVVVAAGAWSGKFARQIGDRVLLESQRGYNTTLPDPGLRVTRELLFAEHKFVATPLDCGLRIGGAVEFGGLNAAPNFKRSDTLATLAARYLPGLKIDGGTRWAGHRPSTPDSLPVIGRSARHPSVYYAFGHGHLGLTQAATTGRLIADMIARRPPPIDMAPFAIERFA